MSTVRASGKPMRAAKCEKSSPMAKVAEVNTQAQGRDSTYSRSRSAISKGVYCSSNPLGLASTQRSPVSSDSSRRAASELASVAARRPQFATAAPAPRPSRRDAMSLMPVSSSGNASRKASGRLAHSWRPGPRCKAPRSSSSWVSTEMTAVTVAGSRTPAAIISAVMSRNRSCTWRDRPGLAEELRRDVRNLVRLVEDDGLRARQQIAEALLLEREIREQQMVIHDHDVGRLGVAPRLEHMTVRELGHSDPRQFSRVEVICGQSEDCSGKSVSSDRSPALVVAAQREIRASMRAAPRSPPSKDPCRVASSSRCRQR